LVNIKGIFYLSDSFRKAITPGFKTIVSDLVAAEAILPSLNGHKAGDVVELSDVQMSREQVVARRKRELKLATIRHKFSLAVEKLPETSDEGLQSISEVLLEIENIL